MHSCMNDGVGETFMLSSNEHAPTLGLCEWSPELVDLTVLKIFITYYICLLFIFEHCEYWMYIPCSAVSQFSATPEIICSYNSGWVTPIVLQPTSLDSIRSSYCAPAGILPNDFQSFCIRLWVYPNRLASTTVHTTFVFDVYRTANNCMHYARITRIHTIFGECAELCGRCITIDVVLCVVHCNISCVCKQRVGSDNGNRKRWTRLHRVVHFLLIEQEKHTEISVHVRKPNTFHFAYQ